MKVFAHYIETEKKTTQNIMQKCDNFVLLNQKTFFYIPIKH